MKILDYIIILAALVWFILATRYIINMKKQGKSICCGNHCNNCSNCDLGKNKK